MLYVLHKLFTAYHLQFLGLGAISEQVGIHYLT